MLSILLKQTEIKHAFQSALAVIRKKYMCHGTGSTSVRIRKKSCGSASADWCVHCSHVFGECTKQQH